MVLAGVVQCHHLGRVGHYPELAAAQGAIALVCGGGYGVGSPITVPFGGRDPIFNTNPLAWAAPAPDGRIMADFATTAGANARVMMARERGEPLPEGFAVDAEGRPTTDAEAVAAGGALLPFGGHKGYALMTLIEVLTRLVMGGDEYAEAGRGGPVYGHQGVCLLLLRPNLFRPSADYQAGVGELVDALRAVRPAPGFAEVLAPGRPGAAHPRDAHPRRHPPAGRGVAIVAGHRRRRGSRYAVSLSGCGAEKEVRYPCSRHTRSIGGVSWLPSSRPRISSRCRRRSSPIFTGTNISKSANNMGVSC